MGTLENALLSVEELDGRHFVQVHVQRQSEPVSLTNHFDEHPLAALPIKLDIY